MDRLIVKVGGAVAIDAATTVSGLVAEGHECCVVHGAGPQISAEMKRRGLTPRFVGGRRVTGATVLAIVRDSLLDVNAGLCAAIGPRAVGLAGDEIGLRAVRVRELGLVGEALPSSPAPVTRALGRSRIPVVAPLAEGPLNVNADDAATALAVGLRADRILFVTDVPGILLEQSVVPELHARDADRLLGTGTLAGGIVPKLQAAIRAARLGVRAQIGATTVLP
jgi:acetylglutamate kinase